MSGSQKLILFLSLLSLINCCSEPCASEISRLQSELKIFSKARELLLKNETREFITLLPTSDPSWSLSKLVPKASVTTSYQVSITQFITLKSMPGALHGNNLGLLIGTSNGHLELRETTGFLLYKLDLGYSPFQIAATNTLDEMRFACLTPRNSLEIFTIIIETSLRTVSIEDFGLQTNKVYISIYKDTEVELAERPSSLLFYIKGGKKYWVVGDEASGLTFITLTGTKETSGNVGHGKILALDRFGPQIILSAEKGTGVVNMNTFNLQQKCSTTGESISLDATNSTNIVHVASGESLVVLDTRVVDDERLACRVVKKVEAQCEKVVSSKEFLICWNRGTAVFYSPQRFEEINRLEVFKNNDGMSSFSSFRIAGGGHFIAFSLGYKTAIFELTASKASSMAMDFTNIRYALVILVVIGVGYWQYSKERKPPVSKAKKNN